MRDSETCPKCRSRKIFVVAEVGNEHETLTATVPLPVAVGAVLVQGGGVFGGTTKQIVKAGTFEAWVCAKCGFTELYAKKLAAIARLAEKSSCVRVIEHEPEPAGPYRA